MSEFYVLCSNPKCHFNGKNKGSLMMFCPLCGESLIDACPHCRHPMEDKGNYCRSCGHRIKPEPDSEDAQTVNK